MVLLLMQEEIWTGTLIVTLYLEDVIAVSPFCHGISHAHVVCSAANSAQSLQPHTERPIRSTMLYNAFTDGNDVSSVSFSNIFSITIL